MLPVVTAEEMRAIDAAAPEPVETLIRRAGWATARAALDMLGGGYGRRVIVVAGKGNNGNDGRAAAEVLRRRGVRVEVLHAASLPARLPPSDLVIDAAYGTGFRGAYEPPDPAGAPVLSVDVPSGTELRADRTVTFAALKPGLLLGDGSERAGRVEVADIGLDVGRARIHVVEDADVVAAFPHRPHDGHKWQTAVYIVAGSPGMWGAASLVSRSAMRAGAGYALLGVPAVSPDQLPVSEAVGVALPAAGWEAEVLGGLDRYRALVVGPGLGRSKTTAAAVRGLVAQAELPTVVDADGLHALGEPAPAVSVLRSRRAPVILTPHAGEFARLAGRPVGDDPIADARELASATGAVVLLKGATTVVSAPGGNVLLVTSGSPRLATAGTGDVLSGVIGAFLAAGLDPLPAAALAAHVHGAASEWGHAVGLVASDLHDLIARWLSIHLSGDAEEQH